MAATRPSLWERRNIPGEQRVLISGQDITEKKKIEVTDSLKLYELYAASQKSKEQS
jgi:hypothetical protein